MGLAYIHNRPIDSGEANVGAVLRMAEAFARAGLEVDLTTYGPSDDAADGATPSSPAGVRLHLVRGRDGPLSYPALAWAGVARGGAGVVYTRIPQVALYAVARGRRVVLEMHTPIGALRKGERLRALLDLAAPRLQGLVAISPALDQRLREELPHFTGPRLVAPSAAADLGALQGEAPPDHDLGYVGGLNPGKGADFVLDLARRLPHARVLIAGDTSRNPDFAVQAATLANVTLLEGVPAGELRSVMARFRIGLAPYAQMVTGAGTSGIDLAPWMSPLKLAEYASAGKAVVASRLPAVEAMLKDGREALLCTPQDLDAWTQALTRLLADPVEIDRLGSAARSAYEARLSWDARARRIIEACGL